MIKFPNFDLPKDVSGGSDSWDNGPAGVIISNDFFEIAATIPVFTVQPTNQSTTVGGTATFIGLATGTPAPALQWQTLSGVLGPTVSGTTGSPVITNGVTFNGVVGTTYKWSGAGSITFTSGGNVDYLLVGGGGGGLDSVGGGGGGGGFREILNDTVIAGTLSVTVGTGGARALPSGPPNNGTASVFNGQSAAGGGGGGSRDTQNMPGNAGGSGGGGGGDDTQTSWFGGAGNTPATTPAQGYNGGNGTDGGAFAAGGGGGGAGGVGLAGTSSGIGVGGAGGPGRSSSITGVPVLYAGGGSGGGSISIPGTAGGSGGGGNGGGSSAATAGVDGLGGGGGGGAHATGLSADGGDGVVILFVPNSTSSWTDVSTGTGFNTGNWTTATQSIAGVTSVRLRATNSAGTTYSNTVTLTVTSTGGLKYWNGSAWVQKTLKYWNGSAWVTKPLKRFNGSVWI